jgi:hypothetical protein
MYSKKAVTKLLQSLLEYEGGEMQSQSEAAGCSASNQRIIQAAKKLDIELDLEGLGILENEDEDILSEAHSEAIAILTEFRDKENKEDRKKNPHLYRS